MSCAIQKKLGALLIAVLFTLPSGMTALAAPDDYQFELVQPQIKQGTDAVVAVRLVHKPTGKPVPGAVIFQTRLDMSPMGMADMTAKATPINTEEPGLYRFKAPITMEGDWAFHLAAKVPGENDTVRGTVRIKAVK